jgi:hypothetical protein
LRLRFGTVTQVHNHPTRRGRVEPAPFAW